MLARGLRGRRGGGWLKCQREEVCVFLCIYAQGIDPLLAIKGQLASNSVRLIENCEIYSAHSLPACLPTTPPLKAFPALPDPLGKPSSRGPRRCPVTSRLLLALFLLLRHSIRRDHACLQFKHRTCIWRNPGHFPERAIICILHNGLCF